MRLGGPVFGEVSSPQEWIAALQKQNYRAAYCPIPPNSSDETIREYSRAAQNADIVVAEVGAWSNPLAPDEETRNAAIAHCIASLDLAERIGARCCVNISGSRGAQWDGPHEKNLTEETFEMIVETTRAIIDAVKPTRTFYALETMPWMYPDSPENYAQVLAAIDRKGFAVHLDPVNMICSPQRYFGNAEFLRECFRLLGAHIKSCHAKDISLAPQFMTHLDETQPGLGNLDYAVFLRELSALNDVPLMLEHLQSEREYSQAAQHIRGVGAQEGLE